MALNSLGLALRNMRRFEEVITAHQDAAAIHRETGDRHGEGVALNNLETVKAGYPLVVHADVLGRPHAVDVVKDESADRAGHRPADGPADGCIGLVTLPGMPKRGVRAEHRPQHHGRHAYRATEPGRGLRHDLGDRRRERARIGPLADHGRLLGDV